MLRLGEDASESEALSLGVEQGQKGGIGKMIVQLAGHFWGDS